jgi:hypothetical protein
MIATGRPNILEPAWRSTPGAERNRTAGISSSLAGACNVQSGAKQALTIRRKVGNMKDVPYYIHWWFIQMSLPNLVVIVSMIAVFVLALVLPYPHRQRRGGAR